LIRIGFTFDPQKFVVERRPLGQLAVGERLPQDVTRERVQLLFDQNYVGLSPEAQREYDAVNENWNRKMIAKSEANAVGKPGERVPFQGPLSRAKRK
jgi:hypothetical protein